ncbi:MAG: hypothetical protein ACW981_08305 [Candidatus Hodarchaeales archaeon]|jgi:hypothetical protein
MSKNNENTELDDYDSWEFTQSYKKNELISKLRKIVENLEKGKVKVEVKESKESSAMPLDTELSSEEILCTIEYDLEPMFIDEKAKKGYLGIKLFWSDLGIDKLIEEEGMLDELEDDEDYDSEDDYQENEED